MTWPEVIHWIGAFAIATGLVVMALSVSALLWIALDTVLSWWERKR